MKQVLNRSNKKELLKVVEGDEVYYLVLELKTDKKIKFDYWSYELAIEEFYRGSF